MWSDVASQSVLTRFVASYNLQRLSSKGRGSPSLNGRLAEIMKRGGCGGQIEQSLPAFWRPMRCYTERKDKGYGGINSCMRSSVGLNNSLCVFCSEAGAQMPRKRTRVYQYMTPQTRTRHLAHERECLTCIADKAFKEIHHAAGRLTPTLTIGVDRLRLRPLRLLRVKKSVFFCPGSIQPWQPGHRGLPPPLFVGRSD